MSAHDIAMAAGLPMNPSGPNLSMSGPAQALPCNAFGLATPGGSEDGQGDVNDACSGLTAVERAELPTTSISHILALMNGDQRADSLLSAELIALAGGPNVSIAHFGTETVVVLGSGNAVPPLSTHAEGCDKDVNYKIYEINGNGCAGFVIIGDVRTGFATFQSSLNKTAVMLNEKKSKSCIACLDLAVSEKYQLPKAADPPLKYLHKLGPKRNDGISDLYPGTVAVFDMDGVESVSGRMNLVDVKPYVLPGEFHQFKKFPKEVQAMIWNRAVEGRHLYAHELTVPCWAPEGHVAPSGTSTTYIFGKGLLGGGFLPTVGYVSRDVKSHLLSTGKYKSLFQTRYGGHAVYFNNEVDILHLVPEQVWNRRGQPFYHRPSGIFHNSLWQRHEVDLITRIAFNLEIFEIFGGWALDNIRSLTGVEELVITCQTFAKIHEKFVMKLEFDGWCYTSYHVSYRTADGCLLEDSRAIDAAFEELGDVTSKGRIRWLVQRLSFEYSTRPKDFPECTTAVIEFLPLGPRHLFAPH